MAGRTGRRPGNPDTREAILSAARSVFAERGYDKASIRTIASAAEVDPALVHHYFGTKDQLFLAAMQSPIDPGQILPEVLAGGPDGAGERMVRMILRVWDGPAGKAGVALIRSAMTNDWTARLFREFISTQVLRRAMTELAVDPAEAPLRSNLVASQIGGMIMMRYVIRLEPIASASPETVVATIGPTLQRYLTGELPVALRGV
ncbi:TetR/AcrR family transcriptional regulator [Catenuloplanes atrovinosus]|uniref:AcrR family transcriptional regulator n=1 Tax=Catenuloplanes atrovinosus TaxID=137266 RepID=A0AAE4CCL7_9ACTN|nr:TetR family transcriptional regulator [Catenuloplanes atrovinosus]MDR7278114.1 AcrR family transcriptional regulator [Catenuloplanes atrovinosus]